MRGAGAGHISNVMIHYSLRCAEGHAFEGWFPDAAGFERQRDQGLLACAECGSIHVDRALMAPRVRTSRKRGATPKAEAPASAKPPVMEVSPVERAMAELRRRIEANSTDVGRDFAAQARAMHEGSAERRSIHGEAAPDEARALVEDGVPVLPLPFVPRRKAN